MLEDIFIIADEPEEKAATDMSDKPEVKYLVRNLLRATVCVNLDGYDERGRRKSLILSRKGRKGDRALLSEQDYKSPEMQRLLYKKKVEARKAN